jgi:hypothetical protein
MLLSFYQAYRRTTDVGRNVERCRQLIELQREEEVALNLKKMDLLKVKVGVVTYVLYVLHVLT